MDENPVTHSLTDERPVGVVDGEQVGLKPKFVSVKDAGLFLGRLSSREIYRLLEKGELKSAAHGRRCLVTVASLEAYAKKLIDEAEQQALATA